MNLPCYYDHAIFALETHNYTHTGLFTEDQENTFWQLDGGLGAAGTTFESRYGVREEKVGEML